MNYELDPRKLEDALLKFFSQDLVRIFHEKKWTNDRQWTDCIQEQLAIIGHNFNFLVYASNSRCPQADGPEWLYDHHWRIVFEDVLIRIPLVLEIEWGFGKSTLFQKITEDFLKLVQARADLRVMVFQGNDIDTTTENLISMVRRFNGSQQGDRWLFAGWGWDTDRMHCRLWSA